MSFKSVIAKLKTYETDVLLGLKKVEGVAVKVSTDTVAQATVEAVTSTLFGASAAKAEAAVFEVVDKLAVALQSNDAAVTAGLTNAGLDLTTINNFKAVVTAVKSV